MFGVKGAAGGLKPPLCCSQPEDAALSLSFQSSGCRALPYPTLNPSHAQVATSLLPFWEETSV